MGGLQKPVSQVRILPGGAAGGTGQTWYLATLSSAIHCLFIVYGAAQQVRHRRVDTPARHVVVLSHADPRVSEVVRTDPRRQSLVVDQRRHGLTE